MDTSKVNRVEIIDHSEVNVEGDFERGRVYVKWKPRLRVELALQDEERTLKIFISDPQ